MLLDGMCFCQVAESWPDKRLYNMWTLQYVAESLLFRLGKVMRKRCWLADM